MTSSESVARAVIVVIIGVVALAAAWALFVVLPGTLTDLLGIVLALGVTLVAVRVAGNVASSVVPPHNVAQVSVEGPITRDGGGGITSAPIGASADDVVEQIERADADRGADALLLHLNTPGGEIVPSEDIRIAAERFDGPTVAYATDVCASGGYDIAAGCDELWARKGSIVGSIGVIGSRVNAKDLADRLGVDYEQFTAGEYKDAGVPLKEMREDERRYLQGIVDEYYDQFVETVAEGREMDPDEIRQTEARVFLGVDAAERGLVDRIGTREDVETHLETRLGEPVTVTEFEPQRGVLQRVRGSAQRLAYVFGAGIAGAVDSDVDGLSFRR